LAFGVCFFLEFSTLKYKIYTPVEYIIKKIEGKNVMMQELCTVVYFLGTLFFVDQEKG